VDTNTPVGADTRSAPALVAPIVVFAVTTAVIAVPYWTADYASISDDGIFGFWLLVAVVLVLGTFLAASLSEVPLVLPALGMLACAPIAVMGRVLIDTAADPTSHNLWPFEVVLSSMMSVPAVAVGVVLAWVVRRLSPRRD
jgi:hypothetical protein